MINRIKLEHLVELMASENYRDRFVAEYIQLKQRYEKLKRFNTKIEAATRTQHLDNGVDEPLHDCPAGLLREQQAAMGEYLHLLEVRAVIEDIDLEDVIKYYIYKALKTESEYHGFAVCECGRTVKMNLEPSNGERGYIFTDREGSEELPDGVMRLEDTLTAFECCERRCEGGEDACEKCPCAHVIEPHSCSGVAPLIKSGFYYLRKYANNK